MKKGTIFSLFAIFLLAVLIRLLPIFKFAVWGSDSGEYYHILDSLVTTYQIPTEYHGWGFAYPLFPGMYFINGVVVKLTGIETLPALSIVVPVLAAFSIFPVFLIAHAISKNELVGIVSAGFIAVVLPHTFVTSHPIPGAIGELLLLFCIVFLIKAYDDLKMLIPLGLCSIALIVTHHLSTYMLLIAVIAVFIFRVVLKIPDNERSGSRPTGSKGENRADKNSLSIPGKLKTERYYVDLCYISILLFAVLIYWLLIAVPFGERIIEKGLGAPLWILPIFAAAGVLVLIGLLRVRGKFKWRYIPKSPAPNNFRLSAVLRKYITCGTGGLLVVAAVAWLGIPGTDMGMDKLLLLYFVPTLVFIAFAGSLRTFAAPNKNRILIYAWLVAIFTSYIISVLTSSRELVSYRHLQYLMAPIAVWVGTNFVGMVRRVSIDTPIGTSIDTPGDTLKNANGLSMKRKVVAASIFILLLTVNVLASSPPKMIIGGFQEGSTVEDLDSCDWVRVSLPPSTNGFDSSTIATDHRMSSLVFGFTSINCTWDYAHDTFHAPNFESAEDELRMCSTPTGKKRIDYVLLDTEIKSNVALLQWEDPEPMSQKAIDKFEQEPFVKVYDNGYVEIYRVVWKKWSVIGDQVIE